MSELSLVAKQVKFGDLSNGTLKFASDGTNVVGVTALVDELGDLITTSEGLPVTGTVAIANLPATQQIAGAAMAPVASAGLEAAHLLKASAGSLAKLTCAIGAVSGWLLLLDADAIPADGVVEPIYAVQVQSFGTSGGYEADWNRPLSFVNGLVAVFSTTGPFLKTGSATAAFFAQLQ